MGIVGTIEDEVALPSNGGTTGGELVKPGTRNRKWETGDEKWAFFFLHNCPSAHLLEQTSARR